jgi:hypothetical protein
MQISVQAIIALSAIAAPMAPGESNGTTGGDTGHLVEFRLVMEAPAHPYEAYPFERAAVYLHVDPVIPDEDLEAVRPIRRSDEFALEFQMTPEAGERFRQVTRTPLGEDLAVLVDSRTHAVLTIRSEVGGRLVLGPDLPESKVDELVRTIRTRWPETDRGA